MPSLRKAINLKCRECIVDPLDRGSAAQQIAACISSDCPLWNVRPVTCVKLPLALLEHWHVDPESLDSRSRALVCSESAELAVSGVEAAHPEPLPCVVLELPQGTL